MTFGVSPVSSFAFDFPKLKALAPPACIERNRKNQMPKMSRYGKRPIRIVVNDARGSSAWICTPCSVSRFTSSAEFSIGSITLNFCTKRPLTGTFCLNSPVTSLPP